MMKVGVIVSNPGEEVIFMFEMCNEGQVQQFVICGHVERRWTIRLWIVVMVIGVMLLPI